MEKEILSYYLETPIGLLLLKSDGEFLSSVSFVEEAGTNSKSQPEILKQAGSTYKKNLESTLCLIYAHVINSYGMKSSKS